MSVQGSLKLAKAHSKQSGHAVIVIEETDLVAIKKYFGDITTVSVKDSWETYFPKGVKSDSIKVAKSGLFNSSMHEVTTLEEESEGWYFPFERDTCTLNFLGTTELSLIRSMMKRVEQYSNLDKKLPVLYVCRKGGLAAIKKTQIKEITEDAITKLIKTCYTPAEVTKFVANKTKIANTFMVRKEYTPLWVGLEKEYPLHYLRRSPPTTNDGVTANFINELSEELRDKFLPFLDKMKKDLVDVFDEEFQRFEEDYPLIGEFSYYSINAVVIKELQLYIKMKQAQRQPKKVKLLNT